MNALVGDIGNTITKVCLIEIKTFKVKKIIYFDNSKIFSNSYLKKKLKNVIKSKIINKVALFSSVVPKYQSLINYLITTGVEPPQPTEPPVESKEATTSEEIDEIYPEAEPGKLKRFFLFLS